MRRMHRHRIDIDPRREGLWAGRSFLWQINLLKPSNYDDQGKRFFPLLIVCILLQVIAVLAMVQYG